MTEIITPSFIPIRVNPEFSESRISAGQFEFYYAATDLVTTVGRTDMRIERRPVRVWQRSETLWGLALDMGTYRDLGFLGYHRDLPYGDGLGFFVYTKPWSEIGKAVLEICKDHFIFSLTKNEPELS